MDRIIKTLEQAGLTPLEAKLYYELLRRGPSTHLELSRATEINRPKVYRLVEGLQDRRLISIKTDSAGKRIIPANPENLLLLLEEEKFKIESQLVNIANIMPALEEMAHNTMQPANFSVKTYQGVAGFKQMLWNELSTKGELLCLETGHLSEIVPDTEWLERFWMQNVKVDMTVKSIKPIDPNYNPHYTKNEQFLSKVYEQKYISPTDLNLTHAISIRHDCVSTYCWRDGQKIGVEIINQHNAQMMRDVFYSYWDRLPTVKRDAYYNQNDDSQQGG